MREYKGHPVDEQLEAFHEKRGHGAVRIHVKLPEQINEFTQAPRVHEAEIPLGLPNGVWTIEGPRGHRTFRISTVLKGESDCKDRHVGKRILELLTGPDNTSSYRGLAWYADPKPIDMYAKFKAKVPFD